MTKQLESLFNLPTSSASATVDLSKDQARAFVEENRSIITEFDSAISKIDSALPLVRDLDAGDAELDELAALAKSKAEEMIDLGMNVDPRFSGVIFQTASTMLGHAITAKTAKFDKKLRTIQLQLQKARLDHQISKDTKDPGEEAVEGQGMILDRNELLKHILGKQDK